MKCTSPKTATISNRDRFELGPRFKHQLVPCGKCLACLSNKRVDWAFRLQQEWKHSKTAFFVTLTYDRKHLAEANYELQKRDLQLYLKKLRKKSPTARIRYYAVGEYGTETLRPHYHLILFNSNEHDIRKSWDGGLVHIGQVSEASIAYCLKYIVQPDALIPSKKKPFALMSRGYGLGAHYLSDDIIKWHKDGGKNYAMIFDQITRLPRFYRDKIWTKQNEREKISLATKWLAIKTARQGLRYFVKKFGVENAKNVMVERKIRQLSQIKLKVKFSQTL